MMPDSDLSLVKLFDQICDQFEQEWSVAKSPEVFRFVERVDAKHRMALWKQLLEIDVELSLRNGRDISLEDYQFPDEELRSYARQLIDKARLHHAENEQRTLPGQPNEVSAKWLGPYKLLQQLGEGGMGSVWLAEQDKPVRRRVAVKLIRPGMGSKEIIARFEAERQALAMMNHPNIAKILDAGTTEQGSPYFVMELVSGKPLTEYCDQHKLSIEERLKLFIEVCCGVQHAHQKGIIHRDLKPGNILVANQDNKPVPKVIDFGLAKAIESTQKLTDQSLFTGIGQILGTLKYMSPEQAAMDSLDVDTRTDIYALGVILYELLTGATPLDNSSIKDKAVVKVLEVIRELEPARPSSKLGSGTDEQISTIVSNRRIERLKLNKVLAGDLDWIVMKALEKDRTRRYESASGFAEDIQRFLNDEPVIARPPSFRYRVSKFVSKNRTVVVAASLVFFSLFGGVIGTTWGMVSANIARSEAEYAESEERKQREEAEKQKVRAEEREQQAIDAVRRFGDVVTENQELKNNPEFEELRKKLLLEPMKFFDSLIKATIENYDTDPSSLTRLSKATKSLGALHVLIGNKANALEAFKKERFILEQMQKLSPDDEKTLISLATCYNNMAVQLRSLGRYDEAFAVHENEKQIYNRLSVEQSGNEDLLFGLANYHKQIGEWYREQTINDKALLSLRESVKTIQSVLDKKPLDKVALAAKANLKNTIAVVLSDNGNAQGAIDAYIEAKATLEEIIEVDPTENDYRSQLAACMINLSDAQLEIGQEAISIKNLLAAVEIMEHLVDKNPTVTDYLTSLSSCYNNLGARYKQAKKFESALEAFSKTIELREKLVAKNPEDPHMQVSLARSYGNKGVAFTQLQNTEKALQFFEKSNSVLSELANKHPKIPDFQASYAVGLLNISPVYWQAGKKANAISSQKKSVVAFEELLKEHPTNTNYSMYLSGALFNLVESLCREGDHQQALDYSRKGIQIQQDALDTNPKNPRFRQFQEMHLARFRSIAVTLKNPKVITEWRVASAKFNRSDPKYADLDRRLMDVIDGKSTANTEESIKLAKRAYETGEYTEAVRLYSEAFKAAQSILDSSDQDVRYSAAKAAALAAIVVEGNSQRIEFEDRVRMRQLAFKWLSVEFTTLRANLKPGDEASALNVSMVLKKIKEEPDFFELRDQELISKLPYEEKSQWSNFWKEVDQLMSECSQATDKLPIPNSKHP